MLHNLNHLEQNSNEETITKITSKNMRTITWQLNHESEPNSVFEEKHL